MKLKNIFLGLFIVFSVFLIADSVKYNNTIKKEETIVLNNNIHKAIEPKENYILTLTASNVENNELKEGYTTIIEANLAPSEENVYFHWSVNGKVLSSNNGIEEKFEWNYMLNKLAITSISNSGSLNIICYASMNDLASEAIAQNAIVINLIKANSTTSEIIDSILNNTTVIIAVISLAASILCRVAIKIFRFGVNYKSNFASVDQQKDFESSLKEEFRAAKSEIQENIIKSSMRVIERETAPLKELYAIRDDVKNTKLSVDMQLKNLDEKYDDLRKTIDSVRDLEKRMNSIQYGDSEPSRRSGK